MYVKNSPIFIMSKIATNQAVILETNIHEKTSFIFIMSLFIFGRILFFYLNVFVLNNTIK